MTLENSYSAILDEEIAKYKNAFLNPLANYNPDVDIPEDLVQLLGTEKLLQTKLAELNAVTITPFKFDALKNVEDYYDKLEQKAEQQKETALRNADSKRDSLRTQHAREVADAKMYNESLTAGVKSKHESLLEYKKDLKHVFERYDISPLDMQLSDDITEKEFNILIDESVRICEKYRAKETSSIYEKIVSPLKGEKNLQFTFCYTAMLLVALYFAAPLAVVPLFYITAKSVTGLHKDIEKLRIAMALMSSVDYARFVSEEDYKSVDDLDLSEVDKELEEALGSIKDYSAEREDAVNKLAAEAADIAKLCTDVTTEVNEAYGEMKQKFNARLNEVQSKIASMMEDYHSFPTVQNNSVVMSHTYTLGRLEGRLDVTAELPLLNIVFDCRDRDKAINLMKLYLANALLSVRVKQLTIEIFDPKNMGGDFVEFVTPETKPYILINQNKLEDILKVYKKYSQDNIIELDKDDIDTFNRRAEEQELVPREYKLLLLVSEFSKLEQGDEGPLFEEYFKFSAASGVMIWMLNTRKYPNSIFIDGTYSLEGNSLEYTRDLGKEAVMTFTKSLATFKDSGIDYKKKFADKYIPEDKWWTWDTISGINLHFGLENGDPTRGLPVTVGDANVHALLGGATGAGKSATINQTLVSLITMYPPSELMLVYIDFKNVEAAKFTRGYINESNEWMDPAVEEGYKKREEYYTRISRIPHLKIISGTTDGEYALSVFEFLMSEMARRQAILNKAGKMKVEELRKDILKGYNKEHGTPKGTWAEMRKDWEWYKPNVYDVYGDLPRLLVIFDEFQVMYNPEFVEQRVIDSINGKITAITKLARAMSCHFWFTSQSMKGTMSKDTMANFSLRGALRCTAEVSDELLGNPAASTIKQKFGFMYTNDSAGQNRDANRKWRVPYLDEEDIPVYVDKLNDMLESHNEKHLLAEFYDEKVLVPSTVMNSWIVKYPESFGDPDVFILGERANYSTNKAPINVRLMNDTGENMLIAAFDRNDMLNLTMTMINNVRQKEDATMIINCQDKDTYALLDLDNLCDPRFVSLASPSQDIQEFCDAILATVEAREESGGPYKPIYVFCIQWERAPVISVDVSYKYQDVFKDILRRAPSVGVHFIFSFKEKLDTPRIIPNACNHRVCGMLTDKDSLFFINSSKVNKLPDANKGAGLFGLYEYGTTLSKFRIYQHEFTGKVAEREIVI